MTLGPSCLEVILNDVWCYCKNDICTVPPTYTTTLKCFLANKDFEHFIGIVLTQQVNEQMKTSAIGLLSIVYKDSTFKIATNAISQGKNDLFDFTSFFCLDFFKTELIVTL